MYKFSKRSEQRLATCHLYLRLTLQEMIKIYDFSVLEGIRSDKRQQELFHLGRSKLDGITKRSKHQAHVVPPEIAGYKLVDGKVKLLTNDKGKTIASLAVDIMPYKEGTNAFSGKWRDKARFYHMMGIVRGIFYQLKKQGVVKGDLRFGLDWDRDDIYTDQNFDDLPHMELINLPESY